MQRLEVFVTVVEQNGYSAAATHLGIAQPSVSYHVHALERSLGTKLVVYRDRGIHLTAEGHSTMRAAQSMLNQAQRLADTIEAMKDGQAGRLALGASIAFEHQFFFDLVVAPFVNDHSDVHVGLEFSHSIGLADRVASGALDMAYVNDWTVPEGLTFARLHTSDLVFLVGPDHALAGESEVTPQQVNDAGLIAAPIESGEVISYHQMLRAAGVRDPLVRVEIDGVQARKLAAQSGLGVLPTFVPKYAGDDAMAPLRTLRLTGATPTIEFGLVTRIDQPWTPLMDDMAGWLRSVTSAAC